MKAPKHVHGYVDRHGKARFYLRRNGLQQRGVLFDKQAVNLRN